MLQRPRIISFNIGVATYTNIRSNSQMSISRHLLQSLHDMPMLGHIFQPARVTHRFTAVVQS